VALVLREWLGKTPVRAKTMQIFWHVYKAWKETGEKNLQSRFAKVLYDLYSNRNDNLDCLFKPPFTDLKLLGLYLRHELPAIAASHLGVGNDDPEFLTRKQNATKPFDKGFHILLDGLTNKIDYVTMMKRSPLEHLMYDAKTTSVNALRLLMNRMEDEKPTDEFLIISHFRQTNRKSCMLPCEKAEWIELQTNIGTDTEMDTFHYNAEFVGTIPEIKVVPKLMFTYVTHLVLFAWEEYKTKMDLLSLGRQPTSATQWKELCNYVVTNAATSDDNRYIAIAHALLKLSGWHHPMASTMDHIQKGIRILTGS